MTHAMSLSVISLNQAIFDMKSTKLKKIINIGLGWLSFSVGVLGIFLPLLPTAIFWIIAVWFWSKSSPHLVQKVYRNPHYGQAVESFMKHGIISRKAKYLAISSMTFSYVLLISFANNTKLTNLVVGIILLTVALWLSLRPEAEPKPTEPFTK